MTTNLMCVLSLDGAQYAINAQQVVEVVHHPTPTPVPLAPQHVEGLVNLRGSVVCTISLPSLLGRTQSCTPVSIVVRHESGTAALLVDDIEYVEAVPSDLFAEVPPTVEEPARALLESVYRNETGLVGVLNVELVVKGGNSCMP